MNEDEITPLKYKGFNLIIDVIGHEDAWALCQAFGGIEINVPSYLDGGISANRLVDGVGKDVAERFCNCFSGYETIYIPKRPRSFRNNKELLLRYVEDQVNKGVKGRILAKTLGVSQRTIRNYKTKIRERKLQQSSTIPENHLSINSNAPLTHHASENRTHTPNTDKNAS